MKNTEIPPQTGDIVTRINEFSQELMAEIMHVRWIDGARFSARLRMRKGYIAHGNKMPPELYDNKVGPGMDILFTGNWSASGFGGWSRTTQRAHKSGQKYNLKP